MEGKALRFEVLAKCPKSKARASLMTLPHYAVETPIFMPVGTQGTMKGLTGNQLRDLNCQIILGNTYHLGMRPGPDVLDQVGGLHAFMDWDRGLLTDSGGFQMVSLVELSEVTEEGVTFKSPYDGKKVLLTPEMSISIQQSIGSDIMMQLDDVIHSKVTGPRVEEAMHRSIRWLDRCINAAKKTSSRQNLFPIIQGGLDLELRRICIEEMVKRDMNGYAIGGLSGGEDKKFFWRTVHFCTERLPKNKPIYVMGVGYAVDLVVCSALGADMFDCVFPTRTARFGSALVPQGQLHLKTQQFADDFTPIDKECKCPTCARYTRAYLHSIAGKETVASHLITIHNITYQMNLMTSIRRSILDGRFPGFVQEFMSNMYPSKSYPEWVVEALAAVNIVLA